MRRARVLLRRRGSDTCHVSFRQTLDLLKVTDEALGALCLECRSVPPQQEILVRALNEIAQGERGAARRAPTYVLLAQGKGPELTASLYALGTEGYALTGPPFRLDLSEAPLISNGRESVTLSNVEDASETLEEYQAFFSPEVGRRIGIPIRNVVSYRVGGDQPGILAGYNYPVPVTRYEAQVLASLAVTLGSFGTLAARVTQVEEAFLYLVGALARASEVNDQITGEHIVRVGRYARALALGAGLSTNDAWIISYSSELHDVGKIHTPRPILRKTAPLTPDEERVMREHTLQGEKIIGTSPRLAVARKIAGGHHENWDGSGYPRGLAGEAIPLEARIVRIADVYDALRSERPYKGAYSHEKACRILLQGDGRIDPNKDFDPNLLAVFERVHPEFQRIHAEVHG